jgi:hypothetical protein
MDIFNQQSRFIANVFMIPVILPLNFIKLQITQKFVTFD